MPFLSQVPDFSGLTFDCQHGPVECEGNMYHACAESHIRGRAVEMAACMIQDNMDPEAAARTCAQRLGYNLTLIHMIL